MKLSRLLEGLEGLRFSGGADVEIGGLAYHSARVRPGDLFVAVPGFRTDGHLYLKEALERGAVGLVVEEGRQVPLPLPPDTALVRAVDTRLALALLSDRFWGHPSGKLALVGVTGTNGKTTTTHLVEAAATRCGIKAGLIGTVTYRVAGRELPVERTTPESADLQRILADMVEAGCGVAAMEVSSHALALRRVEGCEFRVAVFTNLSQDHLDFHRHMEEYYRTKEMLFLPRSMGGLGAAAAAVNADDPYGRRLAASLEGEVLTFGTGEEARLRGWLLEAGLKSSRVRVRYEGWEEEGETALTGIFNLQNILAALAACILLGLDPSASLAGILSHPGVPGRFQAVEEGQDFAVLVDYAHTPDSLRRVLEAARAISRGRLIVVFGCGGDRDRGKRPLMGEIAVRLADLAIITSDNPRSEDPLSIIEEIEKGARRAGEGGSWRVVPDRREAIEMAVGEAESGDVVVIAGKGHERGQIFADRVVPFDDVEEAGKALRRRLGRT
ncbi:UDP-N-acetylmuramoyl-L-alanyl-D-glutamate--2,6-diaminopimelate ligase [Candidatus Solincola sp.]|jgi:UDP-N-acetylmuramoyl-L-alanyl-D-glutamate--2,6-diaminopimelate ligase|nr:UDP-N-acetylmuramoyl-L-alanyl-D-glutamate--2,6-diaminopimelate ligase [Actinomycetota bacterium]MDI7251730.1 UDP-N-acetylmuramoyl-L-alanyl-D-glutamate--2,6-diaminopimelate ligase [Actinomycetota bacterium]